MLETEGAFFPNADRLGMVNVVSIFFFFNLTKDYKKEPVLLRAVITAPSSSSVCSVVCVNGVCKSCISSNEKM